MKTIKTPVMVDGEWLCQADGEPVVETYPDDVVAFTAEGAKQIRERAAELARVLNSHDALVEAVLRSKPILDCSLEWENRSQCPSAIVANNLKRALDAIESALKLAEGK